MATPLGIFESSTSARASKEECQSGNRAMIDGRIAALPCERRRSRKLALVDVPYVGRQAAREFVAQSQLEPAIAQTRTPLPGRVGPPIGVQFDLGFENQALGQVEVILGFEPQGGARSLPDVAGELDVEPIRG